KRTVLLLALLLFITPAMGQDFTVEELQENLKLAETQMAEYQSEYGRLQNIGYAGPVLRKDLEVLGGRVGGLLEEIESILRQLGVLMEMDDGGAPVLSIKASKESYDGPPIAGTLTTGDIVALQGSAEIPGEKGEMRQATLTWQLVDEAGKQVGEYFKQEAIWELGVTLKTKVRFLINEVPTGKYMALLTYTPTDNPTDTTEARVDIEVSRALVVKDTWVTDKPGGKSVKTLKAGKEPYFYVTFEVEEEIKTVAIQLRAKNESTGEHLTLEVIDYAIKPEKKIQRTGIMLQEYALEDVSRILFEAEFELPDGKRVMVDKSVSLMQDEYELTLRAAPTILSGEEGPFSIKLPKDFVPPYKVEFYGDDLYVTESSNPLKGTYSGEAQDKDMVATLTANVTDGEGRQAEGATRVTIKAEDPEVAQSQIQPTLYDKPPPKSSSGSGRTGLPMQHKKRVVIRFSSGTCVANAHTPRQPGDGIKISFCGNAGFASKAEAQRVEACLRQQSSDMPDSVLLHDTYPNGFTNTKKCDPNGYNIELLY
ncbi:hypothetical protein OAN24_06295, partial [Pseudodesulfovibrio sp.]|nr:hypothetical protein [Pseudodesulfovibrio sp.]